MKIIGERGTKKEITVIVWDYVLHQNQSHNKVLNVTYIETCKDTIQRCVHTPQISLHFVKCINYGHVHDLGLIH